MLTSSGEDRDLLATYELGVNSYIQKPLDFDRLQQRGGSARHIVERRVAILRKPYSPALLCRRVREALDAATLIPAGHV